MSSQNNSSQERDNGGKERKTKDKRKNKNNSKGNIFLRNLIDILNNNLKLKKVRNILAIILIALSVISVWSLFYFNNVLPNAEIYDVKFKVNSGNPEQPSLYIDARVYEPRIGMAGKTDEPRPLVVLVHGYAMSKEFMYSFSIELARRGVSSISFSMPGHGFSGSPYYFTNVSTRAVSEAINFMLNNSKFPIDTARLGVIGHSMGAMTAIKAGYLDHRLCFTIALAAPSGETRLLISSPEFNLNFLNESIPSYTNLTYPRNLYFILGKNDEFVKDIDARLIMSKAIGISADEIQINQVYNENFTAGTSRKYSLYPLMDHLTESISPRSVGDALDWVARSFQIDPNNFNKNIRIVSLYR
ncbi:MAG: alpha/beta hydrolase family protein, partial [Promethearchaeota archaeon]